MLTVQCSVFNFECMKSQQHGQTLYEIVFYFFLLFVHFLLACVYFPSLFCFIRPHYIHVQFRFTNISRYLNKYTFKIFFLNLQSHTCFLCILFFRFFFLFSSLFSLLLPFILVSAFSSESRIPIVQYHRSLFCIFTCLPFYVCSAHTILSYLLCVVCCVSIVGTLCYALYGGVYSNQKSTLTLIFSWNKHSLVGH